MSKSMRSRMVYRALVQRPTVGATDADGHPSYAGWTTLHTALPIYVWEKQSEEKFSTGQTAVISECYAEVPLNTDIQVKDRINGIKLRNGSDFNNKLYRVEAVNRRGLSHLELDLRIVTS